MASSPAGLAALTDGLYSVPIFIGCSLSLLACAVILWSYYSYEELRRHPNGIVAAKTFLDMAFAVLLIVEQGLRASGHDIRKADCRGSSFFFELVLVSSELCFFFLSYDLYVALHNPFVDYKANLRKYILVAIVIAVIMASILVGAGDRVYGMTNFGVCWIKPVYAPVSGYMWAFFYWLLVTSFAWSFFVLIYARMRLSKGLRETYEARMTSFRHGATFAIGYSTFWLVIAIVYWITLAQDTAPDRTGAAWVFTLLFSCRGLATLGVWLYNHNLREIARQEARLREAGGRLGKVNRQLHPHLNLALRREILHYTTLAIRLSIVQAVGEGRMKEMVRRMKEQLRQSRAAMKAALAFASALRSPAPAAPGPSATGGGGGPPGTRPHLANGVTTGGPSQGTIGDHHTPSPPGGAGGGATPSAAASLLAAGGNITHDPDIIVAAATKLAPTNDRHPSVPDEELDVSWRPLNIALMAPLFERDGMFDLGEYTAKQPKEASTATSPGGGGRKREGTSGTPATNSSPGGRAGVSAGAGRNAPRATDSVDPDSMMTPTSTTESGVIRRPPLYLQDLAPDVFARIRDLFGISPAQFFFSLSRTTKERFSEGASGAFMCFSHDMKFVIKTMEKDEAEVLARILPYYLQYLRAHRDTLIIKFYACMSLKLYSQTMYFVVMENIFPTRATIHERFDLKGSWVGRSASKGVPGTLAYCRFCNESFKVGSSEYCKARPNRRHVVNTVLKDNDLTYKLRLAQDKATRLGAQLRQDASFLADMGVMDYSLLIGVHNRKFRIDEQVLPPGPPGTGLAPPPPTAATAGGRGNVMVSPLLSSGAAKWDLLRQTHQHARLSGLMSGGGDGSMVGLEGQATSVNPLHAAAMMARGGVGGDINAPPGVGPPPVPGRPVGGRMAARRSTVRLAPLHDLEGDDASGTATSSPQLTSAAAPYHLAVEGGEAMMASEEDDEDEEEGGVPVETGQLGAGAYAPRTPAGPPPHMRAVTALARHGGVAGVRPAAVDGKGMPVGAGADGSTPASPVPTTVTRPPTAPDTTSPAAYGGGTGLSHATTASWGGGDVTRVPFYRMDEGGMASSIIEGPGVFYMGIIDILQEWSFVKRAERWLKAYVLCQDKHGISVVPPEEYADRFERRVVSEIIEQDTQRWLGPSPSAPMPAARRISMAPHRMSIFQRRPSMKPGVGGGATTTSPLSFLGKASAMPSSHGVTTTTRTGSSVV